MRTRLVLVAERSQDLAEGLLALPTHERELGSEPEPVVAQLEVALAAVEPAVAARRAERKLQRSTTSEKRVRRSCLYEAMGGWVRLRYLDVGNVLAHAVAALVVENAGMRNLKRQRVKCGKLFLYLVS